MAQSVLARLELERYESELVMGLIPNHLEMSAALRRDIFDAETVRAFAGKVQTPELLRMLTLFTYADINAVHPDALTPWKAENLWRLYIATANYLDRSVDDERVGAQEASELVHRVAALLPGQRTAVAEYLEGFPERYVRTRIAGAGAVALRDGVAACTRIRCNSTFAMTPSVSEITRGDAGPGAAVCEYDRSAGGVGDEYRDRGRVLEPARASWWTASGLRIRFRTLEMNASEHERFVKSVHEVMTEGGQRWRSC